MKKLIVLITTMLTFVPTVFGQIGSPSSDLVYTPVTPCRIIDTRVAIGQIPAGSTRVYNAGNVASFANQGGSATHCGVTAGLNTAAVAVNFVAVAPAAAGYITVYPNGGTLPTASTLNYVAGDIVANSAIVKVSQTGTTAMSIFSSAATHVVADVVGFYSKPVATALQCVTTGTNQADIAAGAMGAAAAPVCGTGFTSTAVFCDTSSFDMMPIAVPANTNVIPSTLASCAARNSTTATQAVFAYQRCCQIPGR